MLIIVTYGSGWPGLDCTGGHGREEARQREDTSVAGPAEVRQRQKMKVFREAMKANEVRQRQKMRANEPGASRKGKRSGPTGKP